MFPVRHRIAPRAAFGALLLALSLSSRLAAQDTPTGRIVGRIVDAKSGQGIVAAGVQVVGTTIGTVSGVDGRYSIPRVPAGTLTLQVRRIGYSAKTVTGLFLEAGAVLQQDVSLGAATVQLQASVVTVEKEQGSVNSALDAQRNATQIVNAITAEQISRSPDGDAAQAVQRVSGVTVQDGKYVFVRGLGERYTTASLNGARMPSPEPERKVVPLDLLPSGLLQSVTTSKTFTPDLQGDFSGAQVDIRTREFPAARQFSYSSSLGFNDAAWGQPVLRGPRTGGEYFAVVGGARNLPAGLVNPNFGTMSQLQVNRILQSYNNNWSPAAARGLPQGSFGLSAGGNDPVLGQRIGYVVSAQYSAAQEVRRDETQAYGTLNGARVDPLSSYRGETGRISVLWGGIANFSTLLGGATRLSLNNTLSRTSDNEARRDIGFDENLSDTLQRTTLRYVERAIWSSQLAAEQQLGRHKLDYSLTLSGTSRDEPDRSDMAQIVRRTGAGRSFILLASALDGARRSFFALNERNSVVQVNDQLQVGEPSRGNSLKFGAYARATSRASDAPSFASIATGLSTAALSQAPEVIFSPAYTCDACANFVLQPIGQAGSYTASDQTVAGYAMADWGWTSRVRVIVGARLENSRVEVNTVTQLGTRYRARRNDTDLLPSIVVNARLSESQGVRFAVSQTLARPEYRELSPAQFRDVIGGVSVTGNERLQRTLIQNVDLRWEWFPSPSEVVSVGLFAKNFARPIERVEQPSSGGATAQYANAGSAQNIGIELEVRRSLGMFARALEDLTAFSNLTLMTSRVDLKGVTNNVSNPNRAMVGQAPYVLNAGLTYASRSGRTSATLLYNVVGRRIVAAGLLPMPDVYEMPRQIVDASLRMPVARGIEARFDAKNLLDAEYREQQGDLARVTYRSGRVFAFGLSWRP
ncbi:MAG: TonB-dependent receptor [Gemmatimonadetes bacterium]|nr:TonB-dependent receptor [Gemmatimonadota bacterium]